MTQVLNSGGQLSITRPAPDPPSHSINQNMNGGTVNQHVYQAPHQHSNGGGVYDTYLGRQDEK